MKIEVENIVANPYRKIDNYPIDRVKVDALKESIAQTGFWDNLVVREHPDKPGVYQLAYGHHRMQAVRELGIDEVDLPVREIDNATMLRMMAQENGDVYKPHPRIIHETILAAKEFIDGELARYETWEQFRSAENSRAIAGLVENGQQFAALKNKGAGRNIITAFLGSNWKMWMVEQALSVINKPESVSRDAVEKFDSMKSAQRFAQKVTKYNIPVEDQVVLAERIIEDTGGNKRYLETATEEQIKSHLRKDQRERLAEETKDLVPPRDTDLDELQAYVKYATAATHELVTALWRVTKKARELNAEQIHAVESMELNVQMGQLFGAIKAIKPIVGIEGREV